MEFGVEGRKVEERRKRKQRHDSFLFLRYNSDSSLERKSSEDVTNSLVRARRFFLHPMA